MFSGQSCLKVVHILRDVHVTTGCVLIRFTVLQKETNATDWHL